MLRNQASSLPRYIKGLVKEVIHDPGRGAPLAKVAFRNQSASADSALRFRRNGAACLWQTKDADALLAPLIFGD